MGGEAFWRFSLVLYARPGVAEALIALQDRAGCDVNLMLFALWIGAVHGRRFSPEDMAAAAAAVASIGPAIVAPLRALRRQLKTSDDFLEQDLRRRLAALELAGERCAQYRLGRRVGGLALAPSARQRLAIAAANLASYLGGEAPSPEAARITDALAAVMRCRQTGA